LSRRGVSNFAIRFCPVSKRVRTEHNAWGKPPWQIDFRPRQQLLPPAADFAIVGAGFTGLAAAGWLRLLAPRRTVVLLEASHIGAGASGRTGGIVLGETAAGDRPGLGDVLANFQGILGKLDVDCELRLPGVWEIARSEPVEKSENGYRLPGASPISWQDSGRLRVVNEVSGGTLDPGKQVSGLARSAVRLGAMILENAEVHKIEWNEPPEVLLARGKLRAGKVLLATNALSADLSALGETIDPRITLAARTAPLTQEQIEAIGLAARKPFYTVDFPYLWGRLCSDNSMVWGAGLVEPPESGDLTRVDVSGRRAAEMFHRLKARVQGLDPALAKVTFTHFWGGPIAFRAGFEPVFSWHPESPHGLVLGVFAGHGVALSVHLATWAAEALLGRRELPEWGRIGSQTKGARLW
jgi:gamma-glutamylputrescine oxidase